MTVNIAENFCTCVDHECKRHPVNQPGGCTACVAHSLETKTIPACFFRKADPEMAREQDYTFVGFSRFVRDRIDS